MEERGYFDVPRLASIHFLWNIDSQPFGLLRATACSSSSVVGPEVLV
eukprot:COSAG04_NODE_26396_length_295_cov_0.790816_1_plen_46_part_01